MNPLLSSFLVVIVLSLIHLFLIQKEIFEIKIKFISFSAGVSVSYVFLDLLPKLSRGQIAWMSANPNLPFLEKHVYFLALLGMLFFYGMEDFAIRKKEKAFWISFFAYLLFNLLIGYALSNPSNPEIKPLVLFTIAIALHIWIKDRMLCVKDIKKFKIARFFLAGALLFGWIIGMIVQISPEALGLVIAFIGGGMMINVFHYELPRLGRFFPFMTGCLVYAFFYFF